MPLRAGKRCPALTWAAVAVFLSPALLFTSSNRPPWGDRRNREARREASVRRHVQRNPYDILGLSRSSNYEDIRAAFRKLARTYHPDVPGTGDEDRFRSIKEALEELETPAGRARWSGAAGAQRSAAYGASSGSSYASYTSDFRGYGYSEYSDYSDYSAYSEYTRGDPFQREKREDRKRRQRAEREERAQRDREWRRQNKKKEEAKKKARAPDQDMIMERELKKAVKEAKFRQAARKKEWRMRMKEAQENLRRDVEQEITSAWNVVNRFQENQKSTAREKVAKWKSKLEATRSATANQRKEDGENWVQKFAEVQQQAADGREAVGRKFAEKWRDLRDVQSPSQEQVVTPEKINKEIEDLLTQQDERISERWADLYKDMMKSVQRSMNNEPKLWKDRFRTAMIQLGRGGESVERRWLCLFQDTMKDMGEQEMKEVAEWVNDFKHARPWTKKELDRREKLMHVTRRLKTADFGSHQNILKTIDQCHKAEVKRLKWQAWNRNQWIKKFRQEQDRLWKRQQEEELKMTDEFWKAVKDSQLQEAKAEPR